MAKLILLLAVLLSCAMAIQFQTHDVVPYGLREAIFTPSIRWEFKNDDGHLGYLSLGSDGKINGFDNYNERRWRWDDHKKTLLFIAQNGKVSCTFTSFVVDFYGAWHIEGRFRFNNIGWRHYLIEQ